MRRPFLLVSLASLVGLAVVFAACSDEETGGESPTPDASTVGVDVTTVPPAPARDAAVEASPADGGTDAADAATCTPSPVTFLDGGILLAPFPYRQLAESPFACRTFTYFHNATFEGDAGLPPGVTSAFGATYPSPGTHAGNTDSVDGDDGYADGGAPDSGTAHPCFRCRSFFNANGAQGVDFTFDETALGGLPTHAGMVWTDGAGGVTVTFTAYGADGGVLDTQSVNGIGDGSNNGETPEDRFFGAIFPGGIKRITLRHTGGGIEIDHLQYGR